MRNRAFLHSSQSNVKQRKVPNIGALAILLRYSEYGKFKNAIKKAEIAYENSDQEVADHFAHVGEMVSIASKAKRKVEDVHLSRYACYLLVENSDRSKPIVALGQAYFVLLPVTLALKSNKSSPFFSHPKKERSTS